MRLLLVLLLLPLNTHANVQCLDLFNPHIYPGLLAFVNKLLPGQERRQVLGGGAEAQAYLRARREQDGSVTLLVEKVFDQYEGAKETEKQWKALEQFLSEIEFKGLRLARLIGRKPNKTLIFDFIEGAQIPGLDLSDPFNPRENYDKRYLKSLNKLRDALRSRGHRVSDHREANFGNLTVYGSGTQLQFSISPHNVLVHPTTGEMTIIDIDAFTGY